MKKLVRILATTVVLVAAPSTALAVNVSSNDGSGTQHVTAWASKGATLDGTLKSTSGNKVYYSGKVDLSLSSDDVRGRYTSNTTSTSGVSKGGSFASTTFASMQGVHARVCRDKTALPDPCGSWSSRMSK